jgi:5-(carboxyamino)imidazole ribonucleotide mutase
MYAKNFLLLLMNNNLLVGIIMGSDSDFSIMSKASEILEEFGIPYEITIVSAHRTPQRMMEYGNQASKRGLKVIIAGAGGAAHLPGMIASLTNLPVIGVPINSSNSLNGIDSLLSIVQMPTGVPVATVGINNAKNAGLLAARILSISNKIIQDAVDQYRIHQENEVMKKLEKFH